MKKFIKTIVLMLTLFCLLAGSVACGGSSSSWKEPTLKSWGKLVADGGFVAETDNYVYFINGKGTNSDDNGFGAPVKGTLMAITKTDLANAKVENAEIVVPKLFVASDYNAGVKIIGDYVYYGTPNTSKNASGQIASDELVFTKTKLDGTGTKELFNVGSLSAEYRIYSVNNDVVIIYYDATEKAIMEYSESTGKSKVITKTDDKAEVESLANYKFIAENDGKVAVVYVNTVYAEPYYEEKAEGHEYSRLEQSYNKLYYYVAGSSAPTLALDGEVDYVKYETKFTTDTKVFYSETKLSGDVKTYGTEVDKLASKTDRKLINDAARLDAKNVIVSLEEVYLYEAEGTGIIKTTLVGSDKEEREVVAIAPTVSSLITVRDGYIYYYDSENYINRIKLNDTEAKVEKISEGTASTTWFAPEFVSVDNKEFMLYCDNSSTGDFYIKAVELLNNKTEEDDDMIKFTGAFILGKVTDEDNANIVKAIVANATSTTELEFEIVDGKIVFAKVEEAIAVYEKLSKEAKELVEEATVQKIENVKDAIELSKKYFALAEIKDNKDANNQALKTAYESAKAFRDSLIADGNYIEVRQLTPTEFKWYYQEATKLFETK